MHQALPTRFSGTPPLRLGFVSLAALHVLVAGGCQSYARRPLDMAGHQAAFLVVDFGRP